MWSLAGVSAACTRKERRADHLVPAGLSKETVDRRRFGLPVRSRHQLTAARAGSYRSHCEPSQDLWDSIASAWLARCAFDVIHGCVIDALEYPPDQ